MLSWRFGFRVIGVVLSLSLALGWVQASFAQPAAPQPGAAATPSGQGGKERVAVMELEAVGSTPVQASAMSDRLREELLNTGKYTLVDRQQIENVLKEQALQQTGCTSTECAVQVGKVLGVRKLVTGRITKIDEQQWLLSANMIDVETAETQRAPTLPFEGTYFALLTKGIGQLVAALARTPEQAPVSGTSASSAGNASPPPAPASIQRIARLPAGPPPAPLPSPPPAPASVQRIGPKRVLQLPSRLTVFGSAGRPTEFRLPPTTPGSASGLGVEIVNADTLPARVKAGLDEDAWSGVFNATPDSGKLSRIGNQIGIQAFVACKAAYLSNFGSAHTDCFLVDVLNGNDLKNGQDWNISRGDTSEAVMEQLLRDLLTQFTSSK